MTKIRELVRRIATSSETWRLWGEIAADLYQVLPRPN
jgi:hypothetical protein